MAVGSNEWRGVMSKKAGSITIAKYQGIFLRVAFAGFAAMLLACCLGLDATNAQVLYGSLTGNVTDPSGAALPSAHVEAVNVGTGVVSTATTNDHGVYLFSDLQPGTYKVTVSAANF